MAKSKNNKGLRKYMHITPYLLAGLMLLFVTIADITQVRYLYTEIININQRTGQTMNLINSMNGQLQNINQHVLMVISGIGDPTENADSIEQSFQSINGMRNDFENLEGLSDMTLNRFNHAMVFVDAYHSRFQDLRAMWNAEGGIESLGTMSDLYKQYIYPLQVTSTEMLRATIEINSADAGRQQAQAARAYYSVIIIMIVIFVIGSIIIGFISIFAARNRRELEAREKSLREVDARLKTTRQKASDLAVTNVLTGLKNRYALDEDIAERLETDRFNIAVFDMDNFRSINDTYGYDFGDEYLAVVAEALKNEFSNVAEIYNITGNEFCFVFNRDITESQTMGLVQNVQALMSSPFNVLNLTVQLTVSGAVYHYLPGDCLNVNSLLVKLDTTMRNAKMNGGNMVIPVTNI